MTTVPILDGLTSAIGEEITLLAGYRITRLSAPFVPAVPVVSAVGTASSVGGTIVTLSSGTFPAGVLAGQRFRVTTGPRAGRSALIATVDSSTQVTLGTSVLPFASESWEIFTDAQTTMFVESALGFPSPGSVICDGITYSYSARTNTTLTGITREDDVRPRGYIRCVAESLITDGSQIVFNDGYGRTVSLEFDKDGVVSAGFTGVTLTLGMTATQVRNALYDRLVTFETLKVDAYKIGATDLELWHHESGTQGNVAITSFGLPATFVVDGFRDGTRSANGAARSHTPLTQVVEYTRNYSSLDQFRRGFFLSTSTGTDLDDLGNNLGVPRPSELVSDAAYRQVIAALAYKPKGTVQTIENFLNAVLGVGGWEYFEDMTGVFAGATNTFPFGSSASNHPCIVYIRRTNSFTTSSAGKTFVDGQSYFLQSSASTLTIPATADLLYSAKLAPDSGWRLVAEGTSASTTNGINITGPAAAFPTRILAGDVLEILDGPAAGQRGTIATRVSATALTLGAVVGADNYSLTTTSFTASPWRIYRPRSSFRAVIPSAEQYIDYPGSTTAVSGWTYNTVGGLLESTYVSVIPITTDALGPYTEIVCGAGTLDDEIYYSHAARIEPTSHVSFEIVARLDGTPSNNTSRASQWYFDIHDGAYRIRVGMTHHVNHVYVGFTNPGGTGFLTGGAQIEIDHGGTMVFRTFRLEKHGTDFVRFYALESTSGYDHEILVDTQPYSAFTQASAATQLRFGTWKQSPGGGHIPHFEIKSAQWEIDSPRERLNGVFTTGSTAAANPTRLTATGAFVAADVGRRVRITSTSARLAAYGTAQGEWEVATYVGANDVTLRGPEERFAGSIGTQYPRQIYVEHNSHAFTWPDCQGHQIQLLSGPNAGTYTIQYVLDPVTRTRLNNAFSAADLAAGIPGRQYSNLIELSADLPAPADDTLVNWRLLPQFVTDATVSFEIVNAGTVVGSTLTLRQAPASPQLLLLRYATVPSAAVPELGASNTPTATIYPFYLWDNWGWIREYMDIVKPAGVQIDLDNYFEDASGPHIR
jgi:hypothetical protein